MGKGFGDVSVAAQLRDLIERIARREVRRSHPPATYGEVVSFDRRALTAEVRFPGSTETTTVRMGAVQPQKDGQKVRVAPINGDLFLEDVVGPGYFVGVSAVSNATMQQQSSPAGESSFMGHTTVMAQPQWIHATLLGPTEALSAGNGVGFVLVHAGLVGTRLIGAGAAVAVPSSEEAVQVQLTRIRALAEVELLSSHIVIAEGEMNSYTSGSLTQVDDSVADVQPGDLIRVDVFESGTGAKGLTLALGFN